MIKFLNTNYPLREIYFHEVGNVLVSTEDLNEVLMSNGNYVSPDAEVVDDKIFFYVPSEIIYESEKSLQDFILKNI